MKQIIQNTRHRLATLLLLVVAMIIPKVANAAGTQPSGSGTSASPYQIATAANLLWFADQVNNVHNTSICAKLTADITLSGSTDDYVIGTKDYGFKGEFDGAGHTISGVNVTTTKTGNNSYKYAGGLFGCIKASSSETPVVKNLTVAGSVNVTGLTTVYYIGGVIGIAYGNVNISNVTSRVNLTTTSNDKDAHCGGIVASVEWFENGKYDGNLTVSNCVNYGTLNVSCGEICGGIVGYIRNGSITDCLNVGNISNSQDGYTAGILGYVNSTGCTMTRCLNVGTVTNTHTPANAYSVYYKKSIGTISDLYYKSDVGGTPDAATAITAANLKNGSLGYTFASKGWGQSIGDNSVNDAYPIPNKADYKVYQTGSNYYNNITSTIPTGDFTTTIETTAQYQSNLTRIGTTKSFNVTANAGKHNNGVKHNGITLIPTNESDNTKTYSYTVALNNNFEITTANIEYTKPTGSGFATNLPDNLNDKTLGSTVDFWVKPTDNGNCYHVTFNNKTLTPTSTDADKTKHYNFTVDTKNTFSVSTSPYDNGFCTVCGEYQPATKNDNDIYEIANAGQLYAFAQLVNGRDDFNATFNAVLTQNIVVNTGVLTADGSLSENYSTFRVWTPIGNHRKTYKGTFDGQGHTISGLYVNEQKKEYVGLFGYVQEVDNNYDSEIKNVGVTDSYFHGNNSVGGVCGYFDNVSLENCYNTGAVSGKGDYVGGVCGNAQYGSLTNCYNTGAVNGNGNSGGVCGYTVNVSLTKCYNTGAVNGNGNSGGVCGYGFGGSLSNCYNTGAVSGTESVGGVCGKAQYCSLTNCYNTGTVSGTESVGGVCGNTLNVSLKNCHYLSDPNIQGIGSGSGEAIAKTAGQFASGEVAWLLNGSEAGKSPAWRQTIGEDKYPVLDAKKGIVVYSTQEGLNSVIRPTAGTLVGAADVYNFAGIDGKKVYGIEHTGTLAAEHPYVFTTTKNYISFVPSDKEVTDNTETCGLTGVLDQAGVKVYGKDNTAGADVSIVFTATALKYANPKGNTVKYGKCYINAEECFITTSEPVSAMAKSIANFGDGGTTSIDEIDASAGDSEGKTYNLQGVEVGKDYKGIVIVNGKKMVRK